MPCGFHLSHSHCPWPFFGAFFSSRWLMLVIAASGSSMRTSFGFDFYCHRSSRLFAIFPYCTGVWLQLLQALHSFSSFLFNFYLFWMSFLRVCYSVFGEVYVWVKSFDLLFLFLVNQSFFFYLNKLIMKKVDVQW